MKCKNCNDKDSVKYSKYTNGDFCSLKCSRSYSTKKKRKEINIKVSNTLKGSGNNDVIKTCEYCKNEFIVKFQRRNQKCCSYTCASKYRWSDVAYQENISKKLSERNSKGGFCFNSIVSIFNFKGKEIRCDSMIEYKFLEYMCKLYDIVNIDRNKIQIKYNYGDKNRIFIPDFKITFSDNVALCECKSKISKNITDISSRPNYYLSIEPKKLSLSDYCFKNDMIYIWWDTRMNLKKYQYDIIEKYKKTKSVKY